MSELEPGPRAHGRIGLVRAMVMVGIVLGVGTNLAGFHASERPVLTLVVIVVSNLVLMEMHAAAAVLYRNHQGRGEF
jgi:hypothetical protein